jgi:hypothetical protein
VARQLVAKIGVESDLATPGIGLRLGHSEAVLGEVHVPPAQAG